MAEDWNGIAAEVEQALASIGDTSQPNGYPATLRRAGVRTGGPDYAPEYGDPTYHQVICMREFVERKDINGTLIGTSIERVMLSGAAGVEPTDDDKIILGQHLTFVDAATDEALAWQEIARVEPLKPANVAVMYMLDLGS
jgi:hypothetical protein